MWRWTYTRSSEIADEEQKKRSQAYTSIILKFILIILSYCLLIFSKKGDLKKKSLGNPGLNILFYFTLNEYWSFNWFG